MFGTVGPTSGWVYFVYLPAILVIALAPTVAARAWARSRRRAKAGDGNANRSVLVRIVMFVLTLAGFFVLVLLAVPILLYLTG
jgi:hypothetical protein